MVGDHLETSVDSREFGAVPLGAVQGKVLGAPGPPRPAEPFAVLAWGRT